MHIFICVIKWLFLKSLIFWWCSGLLVFHEALLFIIFTVALLLECTKQNSNVDFNLSANY